MTEPRPGRAAPLAAALTAALFSTTALSQTATEKALLERVERQDRTIEELRRQVEELTRILGARISAVEERTGQGKVAMTTPTARIESSAGADFSLQFVGALQAQYGIFAEPRRGAGAPVLHNGTDFRRAHFGVQGTAFRDFAYTLVFDGAAASGSFNAAVRDATVAYTGLRPLTVTIGNQKPQNGLENSFSDRSNAATFMEPGLSGDIAAATGTRNIGVRVSTGGDHYSASLGVFGDDIANNAVANPVTEGYGVHGRATWAPVAAKDRVLHLGVSAYRRHYALGRAAAADPATRQIRFRARPETTVEGTRLVDTGTLARATDGTLVGLEAAGVLGPFSLQSEYMRVQVDQDGGRPDLSFRGGYVYGSWFLAGESRAYDAKTGVFQRVRPWGNLDLRRGTWGAVEAAVRWSFIDLDSRPALAALGGVRGGFQRDVTVGLNWYLNPYLRLMANYIHADVDNTTLAGLDRGLEANIFAFRVHQEW